MMNEVRANLPWRSFTFGLPFPCYVASDPAWGDDRDTARGSHDFAQREFGTECARAPFNVQRHWRMKLASLRKGQ